MKKQFGIVSGEGFGLANTTHRIFDGSLFDIEPSGQAPVQAYVNLANGNLIIQTPLISISELTDNLKFQWTFNSQKPSGTNWMFNWYKQLINPRTDSSVLQFLNEDGHLTTYTKDSTRANAYFANQVGEGNCFFIFNETKKCWMHIDPRTNITEYYNTNGRLISRVTMAGHISTFDYDSIGRLINITGPSNTKYKLDWTATGLDLSIDYQQTITLIRRYVIDNLGRVTKEIYPETKYTVNYNYTNTTTWVASIEQTDNTRVGFSYDYNNNPALMKLMGIIYGIQNRNTIDYSAFPTVKVIDVYQTPIEFVIDPASKLITKKTLPIGYAGLPTLKGEQTSYLYKNGLLDTVTYPDNSTIQYIYHRVSYLKTAEIGPGKRKQTWTYAQGGNFCFLTAKSDFLDPENPKSALATRYVYDAYYPPGDNYQLKVFLRFSINQIGCVTEYRLNDFNMIGSKRIYLDKLFDLTSYPYDDIVPDYTTMLAWIKQQTAANVSLTKYERDARGQVIHELSYDAVDANGVGIENDAADSLTLRQWTIFGDCHLYAERISANVNAENLHIYDDLRREIHRVDSLNRNWHYDYADGNQQLTTTSPDGRTTTSTWDPRGQILNQQAIVNFGSYLEKRTILYRRDFSGFPILIIPPTTEQLEEKLPREHEFFDKQQRSGFKISRIGQVTETRYNSVFRTQLQIIYADPVDISKIYMPDGWPPDSNILPTMSLFVKQLPKQLGPNDRVTLQTFTPTGAVNYAVDEENYLTEYRHDNINRLICSIRYANKITDTEFQLLLQGLSLSRSINFQVDSIERLFYYADNKIQAKQNAAGYITEYFYDAGRRASKTLVYFIPVVVDLSVNDLNSLRPKTHPKDETTYQWSDKKGNEIATVDAEGYLTLNIFYPMGKIKQIKRFANPVIVNGNTIPVALPSTEDQTTTFTYDEAQRLVQVERPHGTTDKTIYDINDNIILSQTFNRNVPNNVAPNFQRNTQAQYDGWNQLVLKATVFVGQPLAEIDADPNTTPEQKQNLKKDVWNQLAEKQTYDECGLLLYKKDSQGGITYFYYDLANRPILQIDPTGIVIQTYFDNFNQAYQQTKFYNKVSSEQLQNLNGGYVTDSLMSYLDSIRNATKDRTVVNEFNKFNTITKITDPENYTHSMGYNFLNKCIVEHTMLDASNTITTTHELDNRGLELKRTISNGTQVVSIRKEYNHPAGLETAEINELGGRTTKDYDRLRRLTTQTNGLNTIDFDRTYDAFDRIQTEKDAEHAQTTHEYVQATHSHITHYPVQGYTVTENFDIFSQTVSIIDAQQNVTTISHSPSGEIAQQIDTQKNTYNIYSCRKISY